MPAPTAGRWTTRWRSWPAAGASTPSATCARPSPPPSVSSDSVSPTAHYTGHVWLRNGLSHEALGTVEGKAMFAATEPLMLSRRLTGQPTLEQYLLARHQVIDELLEAEIESGRVEQVIEIAAGMSPRGWRFTERYGDQLTYIETDLEAMATRKRRALARIGYRPAGHRVVELDALSDGG